MSAPIQLLASYGGSAGPVAFDASSTATGSGVSTLSWTHTPVGTPTAVGVAVYFYENGGAVTGATYGGVAMTQVAADVDTSGDRVYLFGLASPTSGAQTVSLTLSGPAGFFYGVAGAVTVTNSDTTTCFSNVAHANGNDNAPTVTCTSDTNELVMCCVGQDPCGTLTFSGDGTQRWNAASGGLDSGGATMTPGSSVSCPWSTTGSQPWAIVAGSFKKV